MAEVSKAVLITGCSSGIGQATAALLADRGWIVYATARRPESIADLADAGCRTLALDVTDEASMRAALQGHALRAPGHRPAQPASRPRLGRIPGQPVPAAPRVKE